MNGAPATGLSAVDIGILVGFNLAVVVLLRIVLKQVDLRGALREKLPAGAAADSPPPPGSSSRVTALVGAVILACFLWAMGDVGRNSGCAAISRPPRT